MQKLSWKFLAGVGVVGIGSAAPVHADGIDIVPYLARVGWAQSPVGVFAGVLGLMGVNYLLNFAVIGWPAIQHGAVNFKGVAWGLVVLTLLGQVADRLGAMLAAPLAGFIAAGLNLKGEGSWLLPLLAMNFVLSGIAVGGLALYFLRRRWRVTRRRSWVIAVLAAVLTNPAWAMGLWFVGA